MNRIWSALICMALLSGCTPGDPFVGKWRNLGPNSDQNDLEIEKAGDTYIWRDAQGVFRGFAKDRGLLISRSLNVGDLKLAAVELFCTVTDNRQHMDCTSKAQASVVSVEAGTFSYERK